MDNHQTLEADMELQEFVTEAVQSLDMVRETHAPIEISVENGVVTLSGVVLSGVMRRGVLYKAATTPGAQKVIDNLYDDRQIEMNVARALASDEGLKGRLPLIMVRSYRGDVTLSGKVADEQERETITKIASGVAGVRWVVDDMVITGSG